MKSATFNVLSTLVGVGSALAMKAAIGNVWPSEPPKNPADRTVSWKDAIQWAIVSSIGVPRKMMLSFNSRL